MVTTTAQGASRAPASRKDSAALNIIIPLGGKGERFAKQGWKEPKPLVRVGHKEMISHVLDGLSVKAGDTVHILCKTELMQGPLSSLINNRYPSVGLIPISFQTAGAAETVDVGLRSLPELPDGPCLLLDCDTVYTVDILQLARQVGRSNGVFVLKEDPVNDGDKPRYSYVTVDGSSRVTDIAEKVRISQLANTGAYLFESAPTLLQFTEKVIKGDKRFNNEYYTSCVISEMLKAGHAFRAIEIPPTGSISLGTPEQVGAYLAKWRYVFLFDLDGTLVDTREVYVEVWQKLLQPFNVQVTEEIFGQYIEGNNDSLALQLLVPACSISNADLANLSEKKDRMFLEYLDRLRVVPGAMDILKAARAQGHTVAVVTNCNREVAEAILQYCDMESMVELIVVGNECGKPKPFPEPYRKAMDVLAAPTDRTIIFEDSRAGVLSARGVSPKLLVGVATTFGAEALRNMGADIVAKDFTSFLRLEKLIGSCMKPRGDVMRLEGTIFDSLKGRFRDLVKVTVDADRLKGGFIADVVRATLTMGKDQPPIECVIKIKAAPENGSELSQVATDLRLYEREQYFYEAIRDYVTVDAPAFYGTLRDGDTLEAMGVIMGYMPPSAYRLGLDLNKEPLEVSLQLVARVARLHAQFWEKDLRSAFPLLHANNDPVFCPAWPDFITSRWGAFRSRWSALLSPEQMSLGDRIVREFPSIQQRLSSGKGLTLCHGDVKSPNIFFSTASNEPCFIDWQYVIIGKGVQDLAFLMIETYDVPTIQKWGRVLKEYYLLRLAEEGVKGYSTEDFEEDFKAAVCYFPFFVAVWFGTTPTDQLIDVNFPFFFIQRLFFFMDDNKIQEAGFLQGPMSHKLATLPLSNNRLPLSTD